MRRFDYSFLEGLALPPEAAALKESIQALCKLLERRREKDPEQFLAWEAIAAKRSENALAVLELGRLQGFVQALEEAAKGDFLHTLSCALNGESVPQEKSLALGQALSAYGSASRAGVDVLALIPCAVLDAIRISPIPSAPLSCGLLLAQTLLHRAGFSMCRFISLPDALLRYRYFFQWAYEEASRGWDSGANDYTGFICLFLSLLYLCLRELSVQTGTKRKPKRTPPKAKKAAKRTLVEDFVRNSPEPVSKADICKALPQISPTTVEAVLGAMVKSGTVQKLGAARSVRYIKA